METNLSHFHQMATLSPSESVGAQMGSDIVHLDSMMLEILEAGVLSKTDEQLNKESLLKLLSRYACAGIQDLRKQLDKKTRTEVFETLLSITNQ